MARQFSRQLGPEPVPSEPLTLVCIEALECFPSLAATLCVTCLLPFTCPLIPGLSQGLAPTPGPR